MRRTRDPITELRRAIDALPVRTREAMLEGIRSNPIIAGAYTDSRGGICPMLAAHRNGGRTTLLAFARSWDRYASGGRIRSASRRELAMLEAQLEASLLAEEDVDLGAAIADHEALLTRRAESGSDADERVFAEIKAGRIGAATGGVKRLRPRRSDAERALARLDLLELASRL